MEQQLTDVLLNNGGSGVLLVLAVLLFREVKRIGERLNFLEGYIKGQTNERQGQPVKGA